jgi:hypothetical protein
MRERTGGTALTVLVSVIILLGVTWAVAQDADKEVSVKLMKIRASGAGDEKKIDPELKELEATLKKFSYSTFTLLGTEMRKGRFGDKLVFRLPQDQRLEVVPGPHKKKKDRITLDITVFRGKEELHHLVIALPSKGRPSLLGWPLEVEGGALFLALTAEIAE